MLSFVKTDAITWDPTSTARFPFHLSFLYIFPLLSALSIYLCLTVNPSGSASDLFLGYTIVYSLSLMSLTPHPPTYTPLFSSLLKINNVCGHVVVCYLQQLLDCKLNFIYIYKALESVAEMMSVFIACNSLLWLPVVLSVRQHQEASQPVHINYKLISFPSPDYTIYWMGCTTSFTFISLKQCCNKVMQFLFCFLFWLLALIAEAARWHSW